MSAASLPHALADHARRSADAVALRRKSLGVWQEISYARLAERVAHLAAGLRALGVSAGDAVAVLGDATPEWIATDLAVQSLGARTVAPWPRLPAEAVRADLEGAGVRVAVAADQEQVDKLAGMGLTVVVVDPTGLAGEGYGHALADVEESGAGADLASALDGLDASAAGSVSFDAGAGREPVGHDAGQLVAAARAVADLLGLGAGDRTLAILPPAALAARVHDVYAVLLAGGSCHLPESAASAAVDLEEVRPTSVAVSPRAMELLRSAAEVRAARSQRFKRRVLEWGDGGDGGARRMLVHRPMARRMGVDAARHMVSVGGPVTEAMGEFFSALGPRVVVLAGPADAAGIVLSDGEPLPGVEARVGDDGRLDAHAPWSGRWLADAAPAPLARRDGDRIRLLGGDGDVVGGQVLPELEARLRDSPYVTEAVVSPAGTGLRAGVGLDVEAVGVWAARNDVYAATPQALAEHPDVVALVRSEVGRLLGDDAPAEVELLTRRLSEQEGELGPLLDVRRDAEPAPA